MRRAALFVPGAWAVAATRERLSGILPTAAAADRPLVGGFAERGRPREREDTEIERLILAPLLLRRDVADTNREAHCYRG